MLNESDFKRDVVVKPEKIYLDASACEWAAGLRRAYCTLTKQLGDSQRKCFVNAKLKGLNF